MAKQRRVSFLTSAHSTLNNFDIVHCDIWGPNSIVAIDGSHFFLIIVDDHSQTTWVYMLKHKYDTRSCLMAFYSLIETQFQTKIKAIISDNGIEFQMKDIFQAKGIIHQKSCVEIPQQNGRVERKHQHILNVARALMFQSHLPPNIGLTVFSQQYTLVIVPPPLFSITKHPLNFFFKSLPNTTI